MSTRTELHEAYEQLADLAPSWQSLQLQAPARRPRPVFQVVGVALAVIVLVIVPAALIQRHFSPGKAEPAGPPNSSVTFPTAFWFGPNSLPGYTVTQANFSPDAQTLTYSQKSTGISVTVTPSASTPDTDAKLSKGTPVRIGTRAGYEVPGDPSKFPLTSIAWKFAPDKWVQIAASTTGKDSQGQQTQKDLPLKQLESLAVKLIPKPDPNIALVKIGYLPKAVQFAYASTYLNQGQMLSPDGTVGTGYRDISFADRKLVAQAGGSLQAVNHSALDIVTVAQPFVPVDKMTHADLPSFNGEGPWTKTTIVGHLAWLGPHAILIQWGTVQVGLASSRVSGDDTTPLLSQAELLKVANSLSGPVGTAQGTGYPLVTALPEGSLG